MVEAAVNRKLARGSYLPHCSRLTLVKDVVHGVTSVAGVFDDDWKTLLVQGVIFEVKRLVKASLNLQLLKELPVFKFHGRFEKWGDCETPPLNCIVEFETSDRVRVIPRPFQPDVSRPVKRVCSGVDFVGILGVDTNGDLRPEGEDGDTAG
jgi:hypothetical protein